MEESTNKNMLSEAMKTGVILAAISIIITLLIYIIDVTILVELKFLLVIIIVSLVVVVYFGKKFRNEELQDGFMSFGDSFKYSFYAFLVSSFIGLIFNIIMYSAIDPELPKILTDQAIINTETMLEGFGTPQEDIDEQIEKLERDLPEDFTVGGLLKGSWKQLVFSAIFALIAGAIIKKKKPEFE